MKFFKPEDFKHIEQMIPICNNILAVITSVANAKLEREGKVVHGWDADKDIYSGWFISKDREYNKQAILINIEPIPCMHPAEKCRYIDITEGTFASCRASYHWICECGARVKPKGFEVAE